MDDKVRLTFGQLSERVRRLANALADRGCRLGDRIAVVSQNCHEYVEAFNACELAGYITAPINFRLTVIEMPKISAGLPTVGTYL